MRKLDIAKVYGSICEQTAEFVSDHRFTDVVIGLSGGLDSSVVAAIACKVLGADHVHGVLMPGPYSSRGSVRDAKRLADNLGISRVRFPITSTFEEFEGVFHTVMDEPLQGLASENTQARIRMCVVMAMSNAFGWMVLNTGNLSEAAMGYSTLYGDTAGAFAPIGGLYKTEVYELARYINSLAEDSGKFAFIPDDVLTKPPSAELSQGQSDEASMGISYADLDELLYKMVEEKIPAESISPEAERIWKKYQANAFKRELEPPFARIA